MVFLPASRGRRHGGSIKSDHLPQQLFGPWLTPTPRYGSLFNSQVVFLLRWGILLFLQVLCLKSSIVCSRETTVQRSGVPFHTLITSIDIQRVASFSSIYIVRTNSRLIDSFRTTRHLSVASQLRNTQRVLNRRLVPSRLTISLYDLFGIASTAPRTNAEKTRHTPDSPSNNSDTAHSNIVAPVQSSLQKQQP